MIRRSNAYFVTTVYTVYIHTMIQSYNQRLLI